MLSVKLRFNQLRQSVARSILGPNRKLKSPRLTLGQITNAEEWVYAQLSSDPDIAALLGSRIFPVVPTKETDLPFISYQRTGTDSNPTMAGQSSLRPNDIRVDYWSTNFGELLSISNLVRGALDDVRDTYVDGCIFEDGSQEEELESYHGWQLYKVWWRE